MYILYIIQYSLLILIDRVEASFMAGVVHDRQREGGKVAMIGDVASRRGSFVPLTSGVSSATSFSRIMPCAPLTRPAIQHMARGVLSESRVRAAITVVVYK